MLTSSYFERSRALLYEFSVLFVVDIIALHVRWNVLLIGSGTVDV